MATWSMLATLLLLILGMIFATQIGSFVILLPIFFVAFLILGWLPYFIMRCPRCRVRLSSGLAVGLYSKRSSRRFHFCPGCAVSLEAPLQHVPTLAP